MLFEWDEEKERINYRKHKVRFSTAVRVFYDPNHIVRFDEAHSDDEDRYNAIGMVDNVLFVVFTERKERTRIISARVATNYERKEYYDSLSSYS